MCLNVHEIGRGKEFSYDGFREQHVLGAFINLICMVAYFAKVVASFTDGDGFVVLTSYRYVLHLVTCPLLVRPGPLFFRPLEFSPRSHRTSLAGRRLAVELGGTVQVFGWSSDVCEHDFCESVVSPLSSKPTME